MRTFLYKLSTDRINDFPAVILKSFLLLLSFIYGFAQRIVYLGYATGLIPKYILSKPVISIGNITLGGVGKTPFVQMLAEKLKDQGHKPVVLIRGYMAGQGSDSTRSDEAKQLKDALKDVPILVGRDRVKNAISALKNLSPDCFILDDGFQHWKLRRDLDIVLIDATNPFGNGALIPRGILREPLSALSRSSLIVLTKADAGEKDLNSIREAIKSVNPEAFIVEASHRVDGLERIFPERHSIALESLRGQTVCAISAIGDPNSFEHSLTQAGARIAKHFIFMDHHLYRPYDLEAAVLFCRQNKISFIVTTQKDAVKLNEIFPKTQDLPDVFVLKVRIEITNGSEGFDGRIAYLFDR